MATNTRVCFSGRCVGADIAERLIRDRDNRLSGPIGDA